MTREAPRNGADAAPRPVVYVLGPTAVMNADATRSAVAGQQGDVLALLAAMHPAGVRTDVLYEVLWGERAPRTAATGLRVVVNRLRDRLNHVHPDAIVNEAGHYRLVLDSLQIDMHQFDQQVQLARQLVDERQFDAAIERFEAALALWQGASFQSTGDLGPLIGVQTRLEESRADAEERLAETLMLAGRNDDAVVAASSIMRDFELRERRWELLVLALYRAGRQAEALRAYRRGERMLAEEYGLVPGPQLAELELRILEQDASLLFDPAQRPTVETAPPLSLTNVLSAIKSKPTVPAIVSPLIGRDDDLHNVAEVLESHRLVTIIGPAGVGKTRLATQLAQNTAHGQVIWLDLLVRDPDSVVAELASQLGVGGHGGEVIDAVLRSLATTPALVVFDNCEHVIDTIAPIAEAMVHHCPALRVVATSRIAFDSESEISIDLAPLDQDAARRLVLDRLAGVEGRLAISDDALNALVDALDRIPLALELVASRLRTRPIATVLDELDDSLDSLSGARHSDRRHVGLNEALDWSIALLDEAALPVYEALGVMVGAFRARDLAAMLDLPIDVVADQLQALAGFSLVDTVAVGDRMAFRALQTVTVHARSRLIEKQLVAATAERHARVFAAVMRRAASDLQGADEEMAVATVRSAIGQIRAAFQWAIVNDLDLAEVLAIDLWEFAFLRLDYGLVSLVPTAVAAMEDNDRLPSAALLGTAAVASWALGMNEEGLALSARAEQVAVAAGEVPPIRAFQARANIASMAADDDTAQTALLDALRSAKKLGEANREADLLVGAVLGLVKVGMVDAAVDVAEQCMTIAIESQNASLIAWARYGRGVAQFDIDPKAARREFVESARVARGVANLWVEAMATSGLVRAHAALGNHREAARLLDPLLERWRSSGIDGMIVEAGHRAALILDAAGLTDAANAAVAALEEFDLAPAMLEFDEAHYRALVERSGLAVPSTPSSSANASRRVPSPAVTDMVVGEIRSLLGQLLKPSGQ